MNSEKVKVEEPKEKKSIWQTDVKDLFKSDALKKDINPKSAIIVVGILALVGLYGYFIVYPKFNEYQVASRNLETSQGELSQYQKKLEELPILKKKYEALEEEAQIKSKELSHDMEDGLFLIGLDKMIKTLEITLKNYSIDEIVKYDNFYGIPMTLNVEGDYRRIRELIYFLENQKNITQVMDYNMNTKITESTVETAKRVYWTRGDSNYHLDRACSNMVPGEVLWNTAKLSGGRKPDSQCVGDVSNTIDVETTTTAHGEVYSSIKFIVYSSGNDAIQLDTDNPGEWTPGKYNPFQDTLN